MEGWEQINGAELYKDVSLSSSGDAQGVKYPTIVSPALEPMPTFPQPSAPSSVARDWETIDKRESWDTQASAPELPLGLQTPPQSCAARTAAYSTGEPPLHADLDLATPALAERSQASNSKLPTAKPGVPSPSFLGQVDAAQAPAQTALAPQPDQSIQMQGLNDLGGVPENLPQAGPAAQPPHVQVTHVLPESSPAPLSDSPAQRVPRVLRRLQAGDRLAAGDKLESSNGLSTALLQHDGNFVVYTRKNLLTSANKAAWSTGTYEGNRKRPLKGHELFAQEDGNLVLYTVDRRVAWASNTDTRSSDAYTLEVTNSGSLVWYCETSGEEVWSSKQR